MSDKKARLLDGEDSGAPVSADAVMEMEQRFVDETPKDTGLTDAIVRQRIEEFGYNELVEDEVNPWLKFLSYFWGPMPIMIWLACIVELVKAAATTEGGWEDFGVLLVLQLVNGSVGYVEERNAGNAIAALKEQLAPQCSVCRNGRWISLPSRELVPGDLIAIKLGDIIPADCVLLDGQPIQVDQAALTGESLPVTFHPGEKVKMGSTIKRGELNAIVVATGSNTFFGKAADMMNIEDTQGRFQKILFRITLWLLAVSLVLTSIIFVYLLVNKEDVLRALSVVIVLLVASIPIAMQVVCTSTMAVGSRRLAQRKVIVARLSAIEELAGMTILCSDKTGTLTQNKLSLRDPVLMGDMDQNEIIFYSALAAKRQEGSQDAIDYCMTQAVPASHRARLSAFKEVDFIPFNPTDKRVEATVEAPDGSVFKVTKGAPQVVLNMSHNCDEIRDRVEGAVQELADRGFRALGVAISYTGVDEPEKWQFQGVLSLFDPPRHDTKETIEQAIEMGVEVKMVTGDQTAIAKETCRELGMGTNILNTDVLTNTSSLAADVDEIILNSNGFAEVFPEHKFAIVDSIRQQGYVTGMTGDGVNDAPALKRADIGIAVEGATDAAKAAADIVLIEPGLSVIIDAILRSRKIFQRMRNYSIYRIACTIQLLCFFFFATLSIRPHSFYHEDTCTRNFTLPVIALVIITILNDGTIITIAYDKVIPHKRPQKWDLTEVVIVSLCLGLVACLSSMVLIALAVMSGDLHNSAADPGWLAKLMKTHNGVVTWGEVQTMMYLKISLSDFLTVFAARTRSWFFERRPGYALLTAFCFATGSSTLLSLFWPMKDNNNKNLHNVAMHPLKDSMAALVVWVYCILWFFLQDACKVITYAILARVRTQEVDRMTELQRYGALGNMIDTERRDARVRGVVREGSHMGRSMGHHSSAEVTALQKKVAALEKRLSDFEGLQAEVEQLRTMMTSS